eukprot:2924806-Alexandrium_andersonii.AAC.1
MLFNNPHRSKIPGAVVALNNKLNAVKAAMSRGLKLPQDLKEAHTEGVEQKRYSKQVVAVDYVLDQILHKPPSSPADIPEFGKKVQAEVKKRNCELPEYCRNMIDSLVKAPAASSAADGSRARGGGGGAPTAVKVEEST